MACVTNATSYIQLNGQLHEAIEGKQGLRQGDPLSPLLFVLHMEYLSRLLSIAMRNPCFQHHLACKAMNLTHLMFANDLMLFCKADPVSLEILMGTLSTFHDTAGLKANR